LAQVESQLHIKGTELLNNEVAKIDADCQDIPNKQLTILADMQKHFEAIQAGAKELHAIMSEAYDKTQLAKGWERMYDTTPVALYTPGLPFLPPAYYKAKQEAYPGTDEVKGLTRILLEQFESGNTWEAPTYEAPVREKFNLNNLDNWE
jgi:hypothetical protein